MLYNRAGTGCNSRLEDNIGTTSAELGTSITANASAHTKATSYTTLIASTTQDAWGITVMLTNTAVASTRTSTLVDIAIGAASSEVVIIANLIGGNASATGGAQGWGHQYFFPIHIPAGVRLSARSQAFTGSDTVNVAIQLHHHYDPNVWYGSRVTTYGADTATSSGTSMSPGNNTYATDVNLSASTTNPIRYIQIGADLLTNTAGTNLRGLIRLTAGTQVLAADLPYLESTTVESVEFVHANMILSHMRFNIPAGVALKVSAMRNGTAATRGWAAYCVD